MGRPVKRGFSWNGVWKSVYEWEKELGLCASTLVHRMENGWTPEEIVLTPRGMSREYARKLRNGCKGCGHWRYMSGTDSQACHYYLDTGELRSVPYEKCERRKSYA